MRKKRLFALMQVEGSKPASCSLCGETTEPARGLALFVLQGGDWWMICPDCADRAGAADLAGALRLWGNCDK